ncbi:MAG TPA: sodium:proton antiporter [Phototrophicaceae bacterium]|nr:sodium:proton antiporter [Phototrophicaceae bacterium]
MTEGVLVSLASVLVLGILAQWIAWRLRLPSILVLLTFGFLAGPVTGFLHVDDLLGDLLFPIVELSVGIILFEGGLSLKLADIRTTGRVIRNLITVGALTTWLLTSAAAYYILHLNLSMAVQIGAVLVVTGPTVIGPLLRHVRPSAQLGSILRWEGILIDPVGATLAVLVFDAILIGDVQSAFLPSLIAIAGVILVGGVIGLIGAGVLVAALSRYLIPDYLQSTVTLMLVVAAFVVAEALQSQAGLLAVTVMGIALANQKEVTIGHIAEFKENIGVILISGLFILLAARLKISDLQGLGWETVLFLVVLILIVRPAAVLLSTFRSGLSWQERLFLAWMAPRGIVAAATASIFALRLEAIHHPQADLLIPTIFAVIVVTCAVYGLSSLPLARWLRLSQANPQGVLIVGAHDWARQMAEVLRDAKQRVILLDINFANVQTARLSGLEAYYGSATSDVRDSLKLEGIGRLLAITSNNEVNALAAIHFIEDFGRAEVYQLPLPHKEGHQRDTVSRELRGRLLFSPEANFAELTRRFDNGAVVKATPLTREFDYQAYQALYGSSALPLFLVDPANHRLFVFAIDAALSPQPGQTIISLIRAATVAPIPETEREQAVMA